MNLARHLVLGSAVCAGCATATPAPHPAPDLALAAARPAATSDAGVVAAHGERAGARPFRLRRSAMLREGECHSQFRFTDGADDGAIDAAFGYGFDERLMFDVTLGTGPDATTLAIADAPDRRYDFGVQWRFSDADSTVRVAGRFDLVLADAYAFEPPLGAVTGFPPATDSSSKVSFQPALLANFPVGEDGVELFASAGLRLGDRTEPTYAIGGGLRVPLGRLDFVTELDFAHQSAHVARVDELYLTPGLEWTVRQRLDLAVGVAIGLTDTSEDWLATVTMGVRF